MIDSYKNIERLRYRMNRDIVKLYTEIKKNSNEQRVLFVSECFSAVASSITALFVTQELFLPIKKYLKYLGEQVFDIIISDVIIDMVALIICMVLLIIVALAINWILVSSRRNKANRRPEGKDTVDHIKEFDNIACDSVFVAIDYKKAYNMTQDFNEKTLLFFEIVHYLKTASNITKKLCEDKGNIRTPQNIVGVDLYRIHNIKAVMMDLNIFIHEEINNINIDSNDKIDLEKKLTNIENQIKKIP